MSIIQRIGRIATLSFLAVLTACATDPASTSSSKAVEPNEQYTFDSPDDAAVALVNAAADLDGDQLRLILGPDAGGLSSGNRLRDEINLQRFATAYDVQHSLVESAPGERTLVVGEDGWEMPVPIVERDGRWLFDTPAGVEEVIRRRIGRNELDAIAFCKELGRAQWSYFAMDPNRDGVREFAPQIGSDDGSRNGLYWPESLGAPYSPIGNAVARARAAGELKEGRHRLHPYRGYYYRVLTRRGPAAPGGAGSYYDSDGRLTVGFAIVAWPELYGDTGVMTFLMADNGIVLEADLGPDTDSIAYRMGEFDPTGEWATADQ